MSPEHEKDEANKSDDAKIKVEDLPLEEADGDTVKGGPVVFIGIEGIDGQIRPRRPGG